MNAWIVTYTVGGEPESAKYNADTHSLADAAYLMERDLIGCDILSIVYMPKGKA